MYGCFWCSVQGHLIKGECTPVTEGRAAFACYFPLGQSQILILGNIHLCPCRREGGWCRLLSLRTESRYIRKPVRPSHACMFACSLQLTVCVRASVFKEIAAVKNSLCQIGGTLCGMYDIVLREKHCFNNAKTRTFFLHRCF